MNGTSTLRRYYDDVGYRSVCRLRVAEHLGEAETIRVPMLRVVQLMMYYIEAWGLDGYLRFKCLSELELTVMAVALAKQGYTVTLRTDPRMV